MKEIMKRVSHEQASQLLHNKFIVVLGDSIQRSVYKDLVLLLQKEKFLSFKQLKTRGEMSFEQDCLVEGGCQSKMHNGTDYREVRQFQSDHHLIRFYFVTRVYSCYMQSILEDIRHGLKPDVVIVNSCVWDISRYFSSWIDDYKENLNKFFEKLQQILPKETLIIWNLTMPLGEKIKGGFLVPEIEHKASQLRQDVIEANFYSGTLADSYGMDVLDLHFQFRFSLHHRTKDGVHWNALAHRRITSLLLQHSAQAWGVVMPCPLTTVEHTEVTDQQPGSENASKPAGICPLESPPTNYFSSMVRHPSKGNYKSYRKEFFHDPLPFGYSSFKKKNPQQQTYRHRVAGVYRPALPPPPPPPPLPFYRHHFRHGQVREGFNYRLPHHFEPYHHHYHDNVMRSHHSRQHYAPYTHYRPRYYARHGRYY